MPHLHQHLRIQITDCRVSTFDCRWSFHTNHQYISCNISMTFHDLCAPVSFYPAASSLRTWKARARGVQVPELSWSLFCRAMRKVHWKAWRRRETAETAEIFRNPGEWDTLPETKHNFHLEDESFLQKETHLPTNPSVFLAAMLVSGCSEYSLESGTWDWYISLHILFM